MKELLLPRPVLFLQVFANIWIIPKEKRNNHSAKEILTLPQHCISETGYHKDGVLFLSDTLRVQEEKILKSGFIILTDYLKDKYAGVDELKLYADAKYPRAADIISVQFENEKLALSLNYSDNRYTIGDPARDDFRFGELNQGDSLRFTLNSKNDSHDQRKYCWFDYIFSGFDFVTKIVFESENKMRIKKKIPLPAKEVSLLKKIY